MFECNAALGCLPSYLSQSFTIKVINVLLEALTFAAAVRGGTDVWGRLPFSAGYEPKQSCVVHMLHTGGRVPLTEIQISLTGNHNIAALFDCYLWELTAVQL